MKGELNGYPEYTKTFWHSLSVAILVVSIGLTFIAYRSNEISFEFGEAKINFSSQVADTKVRLSSEIASSTIALNKAIEEVKKLKSDVKVIKETSASIKKKTETDKPFMTNWGTYPPWDPKQFTSLALPPKLAFDNFDKNIMSAQKSLNNLESLNKQIQQIQ